MASHSKDFISTEKTDFLNNSFYKQQKSNTGRMKAFLSDDEIDDNFNDSVAFRSPVVTPKMTSAFLFPTTEKSKKVSPHKTSILESKSNSTQPPKKVIFNLSSDDLETSKMNNETKHFKDTNTDLFALSKSNNVSSLKSRLQFEAEKIRRWQMTTEKELAEKSAQLFECTSKNDSLQAHISDLTLKLSSTTQQLEFEKNNRKDITTKILGTRQLCEALRGVVDRGEEKLTFIEKESNYFFQTSKLDDAVLKTLLQKFLNLQKNVSISLESVSERFSDCFTELKSCHSELLKKENEIFCKSAKITALSESLAELKKKNDTSEKNLAESLTNLNIVNNQVAVLRNEMKENEILLNDRNSGIDLLSTKVEQLDDLLHEEKNLSASLKLKFLEQRSSAFMYERKSVILFADFYRCLQFSRLALKINSKTLEKHNERIRFISSELEDVNQAYLKEKRDHHEVCLKYDAMENILTDVTNKYDTLKTEHDSLNARLECVEKENSDFKTCISRFSHEKEINDEVIDSMTNSLSSFKSQLNAKENDLIQLTEILSATKISLEEAQSNQIKEGKIIISMQLDLDNLKKEMQERNVELLYEKSLKEKLDLKCKESELLIQRQHEDLSVKQSEIENLDLLLKSESENLNNIIVSSKTEIENLTEKYKTLELRNSDLSSELVLKENFLDDIKAKYDSEQNNHKYLQDKLDKYENANNSLILENNYLSAKCKTLDEIINESSKKIELIQTVSDNVYQDLKEEEQAKKVLEEQLLCETQKSEKLAQDLSYLTTENEILEKQFTAANVNFKGQLEALQLEIKRIKSLNDLEMEKKESFLRQENAKMEENFKSASIKIDTLKDQLVCLDEKYSTSCENYKNEIEGLCQEMLTLKKENERLVSKESSSISLFQNKKDIFNKDKNVCSGIHSSHNKLDKISKISLSFKNNNYKNISTDKGSANKNCETSCLSPLKTPRGILKAPGSASKRRRVIFGGETEDYVSSNDEDICSNWQSDTLSFGNRIASKGKTFLRRATFKDASAGSSKMRKSAIRLPIKQQTSLAITK